MSPWAGRTSVFRQKEKPLLSPRLIPFLLGPNIHIVSRSDDWIRNPSVLQLESLSACQWEFLRMRLRLGTRTLIPVPPFLPETFFICSEIRSKELEGGKEQNFLCKISRKRNSLPLEFQAAGFRFWLATGWRIQFSKPGGRNIFRTDRDKDRDTDRLM